MEVKTALFYQTKESPEDIHLAGSETLSQSQALVKESVRHCDVTTNGGYSHGGTTMRTARRMCHPTAASPLVAGSPGPRTIPLVSFCRHWPSLLKSLSLQAPLMPL